MATLSSKTGCPFEYQTIAFANEILTFGDAVMKQARTLTEKQLKLVLAHCSTRKHAARDRAIVMMSFLAGLRAKEIAALKIEDVMSSDGSLRDEFVLTPHQTKGRRARRVFVNSKLKRELEIYLKSVQLRACSPYLFQSQKGSCFSPNTLCQLLVKTFNECGLDGATSHSGRRTFITNLASKGVGVRVLAELAGHSSPAVTMRYIDVNDTQMRAAVELV
jgi:integrase/recombinase XerD